MTERLHKSVCDPRLRKRNRAWPGAKNCGAAPPPRLPARRRSRRAPVFTARSCCDRAARLHRPQELDPTTARSPSGRRCRDARLAPPPPLREPLLARLAAAPPSRPGRAPNWPPPPRRRGRRRARPPPPRVLDARDAQRRRQRHRRRRRRAGAGVRASLGAQRGEQHREGACVDAARADLSATSTRLPGADVSLEDELRDRVDLQPRRVATLGDRGSGRRRAERERPPASRPRSPRSTSAAMAMGWVIEPVRPERRRCVEADIRRSMLSNVPSVSTLSNSKFDVRPSEKNLTCEVRAVKLAAVRRSFALHRRSSAAFLSLRPCAPRCRRRSHPPTAARRSRQRARTSSSSSSSTSSARSLARCTRLCLTRCSRRSETRSRSSSTR